MGDFTKNHFSQWKILNFERLGVRLKIFGPKYQTEHISPNLVEYVVWRMWQVAVFKGYCREKK